MSRVFALLSGLLLASSTWADDGADKVREAISTLVPGTPITQIEAAPVDGFYEVVLGGQVLYVSEDGKYLMQGTLFDIANRVDLSEQRRGALRMSALAELPADQRLIYGDADAKHRLVVFTDIDCGYCRRLHQQMDEYNAMGITIEYLLYPRAGVGSDSYNKAVSVWCDSDSHEALTKAKDGIDPRPQTCENPVDEHLEIGRNVGVTGTPALVTEDGQLLPGFVPPAQLLERLDALAQAKTAAR